MPKAPESTVAPNRRRAPDACSNGQMPRCWQLFHAVIAYVQRLLLYGLPGTGKTLQALTAGLGPGVNANYVVLTADTPPAEVRGMFVPRAGAFEWQDGPAIATWRTGGRLVLDELDHASGECMNLLMAITDSPKTARLTLPTLELVRPAPGFTVIATMNGDPEQLPPALRDRFPVAIEIDAVHPAALAALPIEIQRAAAATVSLPPERRLSVRAWQTFVELQNHVGVQIAAEVVFGPRAGDVLDSLQLRSAL